MPVSLSRLSGALMLLCSLATLAMAADAGAPQETTVTKAKPTSAVSWSDLDNTKPWELKLTVKAGDPFKAGSASVTSAGIETWKIDKDTEALAAFTGSVPANSAQKQYKPAFNGVFKTDGTQSGKVPTWSVTGTFGVLCTYAKGSTEANGNPSGTSGLTAPAANTTNPANLTFTVKILRQSKPRIIPNRMKDLADQMPEEAGSCSMDPGAQGYDNAASGDAHVDSASTCKPPISTASVLTGRPSSPSCSTWSACEWVRSTACGSTSHFAAAACSGSSGAPEST